MLPLWNGPRRTTWLRTETNISLQEDITIPSNFELMDISKDKKFMAIIDSNFRLQVYGIESDENVIKPVSHRIRDVECNIESYRSIYIFLSVADETGYAAVSYFQLDTRTGLVLKKAFDPNYTHCTVYKETKGDKKISTSIPIQGRAVFIKDILAIVETTGLTVLDAQTFRYKYFLDLSGLNQAYEGMIRAEKPGPNISWAKYYPVIHDTNNRNGGDTLIAMTYHIRSNVLITTERGNFIKVWSILDGSLITSFKKLKDEIIMAISNDNQLIATYNGTTNKVQVYITKIALLLHEYIPEYMEHEENHGAVLFVKFDEHKHYLFITGIKAKELTSQSGNSSGSQLGRQSLNQQTLFFEVWLMSQEKRIIYKEKNVIAGTTRALPFVFEDLQRTLESEDGYFDSDFFGLYMTGEDDNSSTLEVNRFPLLLKHDKKEIFTKSYEGTLWDTYLFRRISNKSLRMRGYAKEMIQPLDDKVETVSYLIKNGDDRFILRFTLHTIQLWKLEEIGQDDYVDDELKFDFTSVVSKINWRGQEKYEATCVEDKGYYNTFEKSTLIYIRAFKGQHYLPLSTFREDWKLELKKEDMFQPNVSFMKDKGRILIDIQCEGRTLKDEIFLQILDSEPTASSESNDSSSEGGGSNIVISSLPVAYHQIESISQAFHYLYFFLDRYKKFEDSNDESEVLKVGKTLFRKTGQLLTALIFDKNETNYFNTVSGSKTLAMLASFPDGQNIIVDMIRSQNFSTSLEVTSYPVSCEAGKNVVENALTVLIQEERFDIFLMLFNTIILNYHVRGSGDLYSLMDTLVFLQNSNLPELLLRCIQRLSYLPSASNINELTATDYTQMSDGGHLDSFTEAGRLKKYNFYSIFGHFNRIIKPTEIHRAESNDSKLRLTARQQCIAPLSYHDILNVIGYASSAVNETSFKTGIIDNRNMDFEEEYTMVEVIIDHKWKNYTRAPFYFTLFIQILYDIFYSAAISFPEEIFGYTPGTSITNSEHKSCIILAIVTGAYLFIQEIRQAVTSKALYFKSAYNYVDFAAFVLPVVTYILLRNNSPFLYEISSVTTLTLCIHFILRLRVHRSIGILLQVIVQLTKEIYSTIVVMCMIVVSFTLAFVVLLRRRDDSFFQEQIEGVLLSTDKNNPFNQSTITLSDQSQQNLFKDPFFALTTVWFFMYGIFDPVFSGEIGNYKMALAFAILYSFFTALIILNVVIAVMNGSIDETRKRGNQNWYKHFSDVVNEIEVFWGWLIEGYRPPFIYYFANKEAVLLHREKIQEEMKTLLESRGLIRRSILESI